ncbi:MAG TPA: PAS domain S-box protein [Terriglobales bacterium]|nr:PAS domain S-box protein [Terriglobales bacterium]
MNNSSQSGSGSRPAKSVGPNATEGFAPSDNGFLDLLPALFQQFSAARVSPMIASDNRASSPPSENILPSIEARYRVLVEQIPAVVFMAFLDGGLSEAYVSPQIEQMLGFTQEEWLDDPLRWYQQIHPEDKERWSIEAAQTFFTGKPFRSAYRVMARDGRIVWFRCEAKLVRKNDGEPWFIHGVGFDITDLKETELALLRETAERERLQKKELENQIAKAEQVESRLAAIVESSDDAIISKTLEGVITTWNAAAARLFGYEAEEIVGRSIFTLVPEEMIQREEEILQKIAAGKRIANLDVQRLTKDNRRVDVSLTESPIKGADGRVIGISTIARDVTEQKRNEERLRVTEKLATAGRLAATIAHEINNPLEALTNLLYIVRQDPASPQAPEYLGRAEEELARVTQLTRQTLSFYRGNREASPMRVGSLISSVLSVFAPRLRNKSIEIHPEMGDDPEIIAVPGELRQVLANLLANSIDAVENGGRIRIRAKLHRRGDEHGIRLTVADSGMGIARDVQSKLFEPFFTTKNEVGTGLGLWVCKNIVEKHAGSIRVKSSAKPGKSWTAFSIFLPNVSAAEKSVA